MLVCGEDLLEVHQELVVVEYEVKSDQALLQVQENIRYHEFEAHRVLDASLVYLSELRVRFDFDYLL